MILTHMLHFNSWTVMEFPSSLSSNERAFLHRAAQSLGYISKSKGLVLPTPTCFLCMSFFIHSANLNGVSLNYISSQASILLKPAMCVSGSERLTASWATAALDRYYGCSGVIRCLVSSSTCPSVLQQVTDPLSLSLSCQVRSYSW